MSDNSPAPIRYCWFDTEFTSLELDQAQLLQLALIVTGPDLVPLAIDDAAGLPDGLVQRNGLSMYLRPPEGWEPSPFIRDHMPEVVRRCRESSHTLDGADAALALYLDRVLGPAPQEIRMRPILAGNSIHTDWFLVRRDLPAFHERLHYRLLDVSGLKSEWRAQGQADSTGLLNKSDPAAITELFPQADLGGGALHDAYYDVQCSIAELAWFRRRPMWA